MRRFLLSLLVVACFSLTALADNTVYKFLSLPTSSYAAALGGTNISLTNGDVSLALQNPSLLSYAPDKAVSLSYVSYVEKVKYGSFIYGQAVDSLSWFCLAFTYLNYGSFDGYDEYNIAQGSFSASDMDLALIYARRLSSHITAGISLKPVYSYIEDYNSFGLALDLGANYNLPSHHFSLGLAVRNFGVQFTPYVDEKGSLPWDVQLGFTKGLSHAPFRFSVSYLNLNKWDLNYIKDGSLYEDQDNVESQYDPDVSWGSMFFRHLLFGVEFLPSQNFNLMVSYNHRRHSEFDMENGSFFNGFAFGGKINIYKFSLGASYSVYGPSGGVFGISLSSALNRFSK